MTVLEMIPNGFSCPLHSIRIVAGLIFVSSVLEFQACVWGTIFGRESSLKMTRPFLLGLSVTKQMAIFSCPPPLYFRKYAARNVLEKKGVSVLKTASYICPDTVERATYNTWKRNKMGCSLVVHWIQVRVGRFMLLRFQALYKYHVKRNPRS